MIIISGDSFLLRSFLKNKKWNFNWMLNKEKVWWRETDDWDWSKRIDFMEALEAEKERLGIEDICVEED